MASAAATLLLASLYFLQGLHWTLSACGNSTMLPAQIDTMLAEYDRDAPPPGGPVTVELALEVRHAAVHEFTSSVRLFADLRMKWQDKRLSWNASSCEWALVAAERLWLPDMTALNAVGERAPDEQLRARVAGDGGVVCIRRVDVSAPLGLDLLHWPDDRQTAVFKFGSRGHDTDEIDINISDFKYVTVWESGAWEIMSVWAGSSLMAGSAGGERRVAEWRVSLARRAAAARLAVTAAFTAGVLLIIATTALPPADRQALYACVAFICCLWLASVLQRLPSSSSTPRVMFVMCALCVCAAMSSMMAALVARVAGFRTPPPRRIRDIVDNLTRRFKISLNETQASCVTWAACAQLVDSAALLAMVTTCLVLTGIYYF